MLNSRIVIADHAAEAILFNRRVVFSFFVVVLLFGILLLNLYQLQVVKYDEYSTRADGNRIKLVPISPNRGMIFDRNGVLLAENSPVNSLELVPEQVPDLAATVAELATLIQIDTEQQQDFFKEVKQQRRFKSIALKEHLTEQEVAILAVQLHRFSGVTLEARLTRNYPYGDVLTHALGYIGKINEKEYKALEAAGLSAAYAASRDIGKVGLEKFYETELHGTVGYQEVEVNSRGRVIRTLREQPAISGDDLFLSLDLGMQLKAQEALGENRGSVIVLDPRDGAVLAFYSNPSYNPNLFVHGISGKNYRMLLNSPDRPLVNRITQGLFPPASTIKPLLGVLGLENGTVTEQTRVPDPGFYRLPKVSRPWRDHFKLGHGYVDIYTGIIKSCDTYFYDLAYKLGIDKISDFMTKAGFGRPSGIDVHEESEGNMPSRAWKKARHKQNWGPGDTINIGIGQGYWQATPLQMALTTATLINNGARLKPRLGMYFHNQQQDKTLLQPLEQVIEVVDPNHWAISREAMRRTAQQEGGTARAAFLGAHYNPAGKTGTQQVINIAAGKKYNAKAINERHRDNAMFIGYAPHDKPEIVVAVVVENAGGGGSNAAPVARIMMDYYFTPVAERAVLPTLAEIAVIQQQRTEAMEKREQRYAEEKAELELRKKKNQPQQTPAEVTKTVDNTEPSRPVTSSELAPAASPQAVVGAQADSAAIANEQTDLAPEQAPTRSEDDPIDE